MPRESIHVGLDIGTTKVCAVVGLVANGRPVEVIGVGVSPSQGIKRGAISSIDQAVESIKHAVDDAEAAAGVKIKAVLVGIAGVHAKGFTSVGRITTREAEVSRGDIERAIQAAKDVDLPSGQEVLHAIPKGFVVDDQEGVKDPTGMYGERLRAEVFLVTVPSTARKNLMKCVRLCDLEPVQLILQPLATSEAVLSPEERELGVAMVDIGGGPTDLVIFIEGGIWHTAVLAVGGIHLTTDVAHGLKTLVPEAERVKVQYGSAMESLVKEDETLEVSGADGRPARMVQRRSMARILQLRAEEIFALVGRELKLARVERMMASGVILTGGSAVMVGMPELAERVLGLPVRRGIPHAAVRRAAATTNPHYTTGIGLILYALRHPEEGATRRQRGVLRRMTARVEGWLKEFF